ncbi:heavy metal transporter [Actinotalea ferrariae CF5-4]|uniref:Heavy metal transporter n=1 Tax=Actinotalea ferrariae CF5-4 TaxID=948458 RepID=A0A021VRE1_9CELL|nr:heavy metal transporter [Actinotalea ferrariae CF5-4]
MRRKSYRVWGLTCSACLALLMERVRSLAGVRSVGVELVAGGASRLVVLAGSTPERQAVQAAVEDAGFSLTAPDSTVSAEVLR